MRRREHASSRELCTVGSPGLTLGLMMLPACAGHTPPARSAADGAPHRECALLGSLRLRIPVPHGYALAISPQACVLVNEDANDAALISFASMPTDGAEAEAMLGSEDGARRWAQASGLLGTDTEALDDALDARLFGRPARAYGLTGRPAGLGPSEIYVLSRRRAGELLLIMLITPEHDTAHRAELLELLASVR